ncbi:MAG: ABC transporter permease [Phycisphaerales bacterium]|nr:ABC transporter permease [Phycisphaerales bacterium]
MDSTPLGRTAAGSVALHMISEGLRMKIALVFLALIGMIVLALPFAVEGDGSLTGAVQSYLSFSLEFTGFFLGVLTIFLARSISDELVNRQSFLVFSKPIARWQYLLGKWLGIALFNFIFLGFSFGCVYGMMKYLIATKPPIEDSYAIGLTPTSKTDLEILKQRKAIIETKTDEKASPDRLRLVNEVLVARHATMFKLPDFVPYAEAEYEQRLREGFYNNIAEPVDRATEIQRLTKKHEAQWRIVHPLDSRTFEFENILCSRSPDDYIQLRYRTEVLDYAPDEVFRSIWVFGDPDKGGTRYMTMPRHMVGRYQIIRVPSDCVAPDGTLTVQFQNVNPYANPEWYEDPEPIFYNSLEITKDGIKCLFVVGSFEGNLLRLFLLMFWKLLFLGALAVLMTSLFSYPVACLASFVVYALAGLRAFMSESLDLMDKSTAPVFGVLGSFLKELFGGDFVKASASFQTLAMEFLNGFLGLMFKIVPDFNAFDGVETLVNGENVTLKWVLLGFSQLVLIQGGIVLALGMLLFYRREVSETSF